MGGHENYTFSEKDGVTTVLVEIDVVDEYADYFIIPILMPWKNLRKYVNKHRLIDQDFKIIIMKILKKILIVLLVIIADSFDYGIVCF